MIVIVTGAAQGIGLATVNLICEFGASVLMVDLNKDLLVSTYKYLDPSRVVADLNILNNMPYKGKQNGKRKDEYQ